MPITEIGSMLLSLCATEPPSLDAASLKDIDTTELIRLANRHGVLPLVSRALSGFSSEAELERDRGHAMKRALVFTAELIRMSDELSNSGIPLSTIARSGDRQATVRRRRDPGIIGLRNVIVRGCEILYRAADVR